MKEGDLITPEYLHEFGIKITYQDLINKKYKVLNVRMEPNVDPQILAELNGKKIMVVVRSAYYPEVGKMPATPLHAKLLKLAKRMQADLTLARVGIGRGDTEDKAEKSKPLVGGVHLIQYSGIEPFG